MTLTGVFLHVVPAESVANLLKRDQRLLRHQAICGEAWRFLPLFSRDNNCCASPEAYELTCPMDLSTRSVFLMVHFLCTKKYVCLPRMAYLLEFISGQAFTDALVKGLLLAVVPTPVGLKGSVRSRVTGTAGAAALAVLP